MGVTTYSLNKILIVLCLGSSLQGLETSSMSIFIGSEYFNEYFKNPSPILQGLIAGSNSAGAFLGSLFTGVISDHFGRVFALQLASLFWIVGSVVSVFAANIVMVGIARVIKGVCIGLCSSVLPVYVNEVYPATKRGSATSFMQLALTMGIMVMYYLSCGCVLLDGDLQFRLAWGIESIPGIFVFFALFSMPESPKWYASRSKWDKASEVLSKLDEVSNNKRAVRRNTNDVSHNDSLDNLKEVLKNTEENAVKCSVVDMFKKPLIKHVIVGASIQAFTQLSGIGVLMYYLTFICEMVGLKGNIKVFAVSIQYVVNVLFTIFPILWLDKMRRKDVIVFGFAKLGISISLVGAVMGIYGHSIPPLYGNASVVWEVVGTPGALCLALCFLFVAIFASTLSCAAWLYTNEIFPQKAKAKGSSISMTTSWVTNFLLTFIAPLLLEYIKWITFLVFGGCCFLAAIIVSFTFPETFGLDDSHISALFKTQADAVNDKPILEDEEKRKEQIDSAATQSTNKSDARSSHSPSIKRREPIRLQDMDLVSVNEAASTDNVSPFLKLMGAPFEGDSETARERAIIASEDNASASFMGGHYYDQSTTYSPFFNHYNNDTDE